MAETKEHKSFCGFCLLKTKSLIILDKRRFLAKIFQKNIYLAKFHFGPNSSDHNLVSSWETGKFPDLALSPPMSRFVREFTLTLTAGLSLLVTAFRGKDGGQQTIGELPEKPHCSCLEIAHYYHRFLIFPFTRQLGDSCNTWWPAVCPACSCLVTLCRMRMEGTGSTLDTPSPPSSSPPTPR